AALTLINRCVECDGTAKPASRDRRGMPRQDVATAADIGDTQSCPGLVSRPQVQRFSMGVQCECRLSKTNPTLGRLLCDRPVARWFPLISFWAFADPEHHIAI